VLDHEVDGKYLQLPSTVVTSRPIVALFKRFQHSLSERMEIG
jgi:hypothetical protein